MTDLGKNDLDGLSKPFLPGDLNAELLGRVALLSAFTALAMAVWQLVAGRPANGLMILLIAITLAGNFVIFDRDSFSEVRLNKLIGIVAVLMLAVGLVSGREFPAITMLIPLLPFVAAAIGAIRSAIVWLVLSAGMLFIIFISGRSHSVPIAEQVHDFTLVYVCVAGILSLILSAVGYSLMGKRAAFLAALDDHKQSLQRANAEAHRASDAKSHFLGRMSHELRTPLNAIIGFTDLLAMDTKNPLPLIQQERLRHIESSGRRLLALVDDVLEVTRDANRDTFASMQPVLPVAVINEAQDAIAELALAKLISIDIDAPAHESTLILADRQYLLDVLGQILTTAIIHCRSGSQVKIVVVGGDENVCLRINASGFEIKPEEMSRLFEPFGQSPLPENTNLGSRLGLTVAKSLIEQMGGGIEVNSMRDEGTTFNLLLPRFRSNMTL